MSATCCLGDSIVNKYAKIYKYHGGGVRGLKRVLDTILQIDMFDLSHRVNTRTLKYDGYSNDQYMWYSPVYTAVSNEMIRQGYDYYTSAVRYTDYDRKTVFLDLGCGAGKTVIQAFETGHFSFVGGVELDENLVKMAQENLEKCSFGADKTKPFVLHANVEVDVWVKSVSDMMRLAGVDPKKSTLFIFNKNSYGPNVLANTLTIAAEEFDSIVYLYQNPVHGKVLIESGFDVVLQDAVDNNAHKNYKYKIYLRNKIQ